MDEEDIELIIDDSTYYISRSILEFDEYFKRAYEHDKKIIFPKLLYEQILHFICNKYTEEHMKLKICMVLSFLHRSENLLSIYNQRYNLDDLDDYEYDEDEDDYEIEN